jgi:hypothetical protein
MHLGSSLLEPKLNQQQSQLEQSLAQRGLTPGSEGYKNAVADFNKSKNDAYTQLLLSGHQQGVSDILAQRNQPINEVSALLSGSQVTQPNFVNTPQANLPTTDYAGLTETNYQQKLQQAMSQYNARQQALGGLFGLGSSLISAF